MHMILKAGQAQERHVAFARMQHDGICVGAIFIDWTQDGVDLDDSDTPVQLQTDSDIFAAEMQAKGIGTDRPIVVGTLALTSIVVNVSSGCQLWTPALNLNARPIF